jgi:biofilm PGA synthesis N-glycosyltransferase PgaC
MQLEYQNFEVLVIDDGSTDETHHRAQRVVAKYGTDRVKVIRQDNAGKAAALNRGIAAARGEFVLCMDADSRLEPQTVRRMVGHFTDARIGAVAGNVKVANRLNLLTRLQALEYVEGLNLLRAAQAFFRMTTVIPGPVGMFRKSVLRKLEGYCSDTFAEDCELTLRIILAGYKIKYESRAIAWTEAPETAQALFKQRYRWTRGILQAIIKHRGLLAHPWREFVRWTFMAVLVFESIAMPAMNVFGLIFFSCAAMWGGLSQLLFLWWAQLAVLDIIAALFCVALEREQVSLVLYAVPYRLFFVPYVDVMRFFASLDETFSVEMVWGRLQRAGRI